MPRYYCDFCQRSFIDDLEARKKHLNGSQHMRLKKEHYDSFRDAKTLYAEECAKEPCKRFLRTGECVFGANCRFSHYSQQQLEALRLQIESEKTTQTSREIKYQPGDGAKKLAEWMQRRTLQQLPTKLQPESEVLWELPSSLQGRADLPPSLQPITLDSFSSAQFEEWG